MTTTFTARLAAGLGTAAIALILQRSAFADEAAAPAQAAPPRPAPAAQAPAADPMKAGREAMAARHAEHMKQMQARQEEMRERAAAQGIEIPEPPAPPEPPKWMSYEEMQAMMRDQGVDLPPLPALPELPRAPAEMPPMPMGGLSPAEGKHVLDIISAMTPEQQDACFALSRWHAASRMPPPPAPMGFQGRPYGPGYGPAQGVPYPPMAAPHQ
jgi:hypothetical protein